MVVVEKVTLTEELQTKLRQLDLFPGSLAEYISLKSKDYEIMDTGKQQKFVYFSSQWLKKQDFVSKIDFKLLGEGTDIGFLAGLIDSGCEGLIRYTERRSISRYDCGIPVKRK